MSLCRIARAAQRDLGEIWCYNGSFDFGQLGAARLNTAQIAGAATV